MSELSDLMAADPEKLTREDRNEIVMHLRVNRERYVAGVKLTPAKKGAAATVPQGGLKLEDLDL